MIVVRGGCEITPNAFDRKTAAAHVSDDVSRSPALYTLKLHALVWPIETEADLATEGAQILSFECSLASAIKPRCAP